MLFAQVGRGSRVGGRRLKQINQRFPGPQRNHAVAGLGFTLLLQDQAQALGVKALHGRKLFGHQRNVVNAFVGKHASLCRFAPSGSRTFFDPNQASTQPKVHRNERNGRKGIQIQIQG